MPGATKQLKEAGAMAQQVGTILRESFNYDFGQINIGKFTQLDQLPKPGESGKIYVVTSTNLQYRWSGYPEDISNDLSPIFFVWFTNISPNFAWTS